MKKVKENYQNIVLVAMMVGISMVSIAQTTTNPISEAADAFDDAKPFVISILTNICGMLAAAALVLAAYLAWFKPERLKENAVGLITGFVILTAAFAIGYLS